MVSKQVIPLKGICIKFVSARVWNFCYGVAPCIELEHSSSDQRLQTAKHVLSCLPQAIMQNIYSHILNHEYELHCDSVWEVVKFSDYRVRRSFNSERTLYQTEILYFISLIFGFDQHSTRILRFVCVSEKDIFFMLKFGSNIYSLRFQDDNFPPLVPGLLTKSSLRMILQSTSNIQELDLEGASYSEQFFKVIGEECNQLKVLRGIVVGKRVLTSNNVGLATQSSFKNLFFKSDTERNMCCNSLQSVPLRMHQDTNPRIFWNTVTLLINNLPNLTSLGDDLIFNPYLQSVCFGEITETNIEEMNIHELTCDLVSVLTIFFPKLKKMEIDIAQIEVLHQLYKFKFLEDLYIIPSIPHRDEIMFSTLVSIQWPVLRNLTLVLGHVDVNITTLALHFPMLTELDIQVRSYTWDRKTYFKCLEKLQLCLLDSDISWFESFANTIVHLHVICPEPVDADTRQIFLRFPFPCMESLDIVPFPYDFGFYTSVIKALPKLRLCAMYMDYESDRTQYVQELSKFLNENNFECAVSGYIIGVHWRDPY